jgi:hypothetical protein
MTLNPLEMAQGLAEAEARAVVARAVVELSLDFGDCGVDL